MLLSTQVDVALRNGAFFINICTRKREPMFAEDPINPYVLSEEGEIAKQCWLEIPDHFLHVDVDEFVIMPDHIHGILVLKKNKPFQIEKFGRPVSGSLPTVVRSYKSAVTKAVNNLENYQEYKVWQNGFYEHRIRNENELSAIRRYIQDNPQVWIEGKHEIW